MATEAGLTDEWRDALTALCDSHGLLFDSIPANAWQAAIAKAYKQRDAIKDIPGILGVGPISLLTFAYRHARPAVQHVD